MTDAPVFILTASRSGSTLLRFILDGHPDLACPPETMIGETCASVLRLFYALENFGAAERSEFHAAPEFTPRSLTVIRETLDIAYGEYLRRRGKKRWCDKSLDTHQFAELILKVYPEARFICLVRHCMDVIASGARNCPWGVSRYGFDPFVAQYPGNTVAAIGAYWLSCARAILAFHDRHTDRSILVRYEDLVTAPDDVMARILSSIDASPAPGIARNSFAMPHEARGPGDEKIWFTSSVSAESMGRGVAVPEIALPPEMKSSINEVLARLGYRTVDANWQSAVGAIDPRADTPVAASPAAGERGPEADTEFGAVLAALTDRLVKGSAARSRQVLAQWPAVAGVTIRLIAESASGDYAETGWRFGDGNGTGPGLASPEDLAGSPIMVAAPATWWSVLDGKANVMAEILAGRFRCFNPNDNHRLRTDEVHAIGALLGLATIPVAHTGTPARTRP